jgi:glycosyltransferase involved in cell wall biosynthesis
MDDCSPDNTPEVAGSFKDARVRYIRNEPNIGHLRNYNKGIRMSKGEYVWLVSADDRLKSKTILNQYVSVMEAAPRVGYAFCPAVGLVDHRETGLLEYAYHGPEDRIIKGHQLLYDLLLSNRVIAASGCVRKECYERLGYFPLDLPFAGDWYLWCLFAFHYDVAYFGEPMVYYRTHDLSMTTSIRTTAPRLCATDDLKVLWRLRDIIAMTRERRLLSACTDAISKRYASDVYAHLTGVMGRMTESDFTQALCSTTSPRSLQNRICSKVFSAIAASYVSATESRHALYWYGRSLKLRPFNLKNAAMLLLLRLGKPGIRLYYWYLSLRRSIYTFQTESK